MSYEQYRYAVKHPESGGDHGRIRPHKNIILQQQSQQQTSYYQPHVSTAQHLDHAWTDTQVHHNGNKNGQYRKKMPETSMDYGRSGSQSYGQQKIFAQFQNQGSHSKNVRSRELHDMDEQDFSDLDEQDQEEEEEQTWRVHGKKHPEPPSGYGRPNKQSHFHTNGSQDRDDPKPTEGPQDYGRPNKRSYEPDNFFVNNRRSHFDENERWTNQIEDYSTHTT